MDFKKSKIVFYISFPFLSFEYNPRIVLKTFKLVKSARQASFSTAQNSIWSSLGFRLKTNNNLSGISNVITSILMSGNYDDDCYIIQPF